MIATANGMTALSPAEARALARLESIVDRGKETFRDVALALLEIRDRKLYRASGESFREYCRRRFDFGQAYSYRLAAAAELILECEEKGLPAPKNEQQARRAMQEAKAARNGHAPTPRDEVDRRIDQSRPGLGKTAKIEELLAKLKKLHRDHPWHLKADELLGLYRDVVLPWPAAEDE